MTTTIDIVIPCLNPRRGMLARAVKSARMIENDALHVGRVIVVDDGSTPPITRTGADCDLRLDQNQWPSSARNAGAARCESDLILFLDADDELLPEGVGELVKLLTNTGAVAGVAAREVCDRTGCSIKHAPREWAGKALPNPGSVFRPIELFSASAMLARKSIFTQGVRFDESIIIVEDRDFIRKVVEIGDVVVSDGPVVRMHREGTTLTSERNLARHVHNYLVLLDRWHDAESDKNFHSAVNWFINACSKSPVPDETWRSLLQAAHARGWSVRYKPRLRRWVKTRVLDKKKANSL